MTTDATRNNAEQWHMPPCQICGPNFLGVCPHGPVRKSVEAQPAPPVDLSQLFGIPRMPSPVDIKPLVDIIDREMQRLRDQLAVERTAASSAREALAACEERARVLGTQFELSKMALEQSKMAAEEGMREHDRMRRELEQAKTVPPGLVPRSAGAVKEAIRLLTGDEPEVYGDGAHAYWVAGLQGGATWDCARIALLKHLQELQPAATVRP